MGIRPIARGRAFVDRWRGILPLLAAEAIIWIGFGALLPILPVYFRDHGVDLAMLGLVVAAWPAARLLAEPVFGWIADHTRRVPLMLIGLVATAIAISLSVVFVGPVEFLVLRAVAGLASAIYDPAARGYLVDATPPERRGEAFGLYGAAQMSGLLVGPAIGGLGAAALGGLGFVFVFCAVATLVAAIAIAVFVHESGAPRATGAGPAIPSVGRAGLPTDESILAGEPIAAIVRDAAPPPPTVSTPATRPPARLWNRLLLSAIALQVGSFYAGGTYEVVWTLFLQSRGAGLDFVGLTFAMFGLPVLLLSPVAGRWVDRRGSLGFLIVGSILPAVCGVAYTVAPETWMVIPLILTEASGFAILSPALFAVVAAGSPVGRSSTAQGLFGAAGTIGTIVASATTGYLAAIDLRLPFWVFSVVMLGSLVIALAIGWRAIAALGPGGSSERRTSPGESELEPPLRATD